MILLFGLSTGRWTEHNIMMPYNDSRGLWTTTHQSLMKWENYSNGRRSRACFGMREKFVGLFRADHESLFVVIRVIFSKIFGAKVLIIESLLFIWRMVGNLIQGWGLSFFCLCEFDYSKNDYFIWSRWKITFCFKEFQPFILTHTYWYNVKNSADSRWFSESCFRFWNLKLDCGHFKGKSGGNYL